MNNAVIRVSLDVNKAGSQVNIPMFQGDTKRTIVFSLTESGKPYKIKDCIVAFTGKKADGNFLNNACTINHANQTIIYALNENESNMQTTTCVGEVECQLVIQKQVVVDGKTILQPLACPYFTITVNKKVYNEEEIMNSEAALSFLEKLYVPLIRKIAGCSLTDNISVSQLREALFYPIIESSKKPTSGNHGEIGQFWIRKNNDLESLYMCIKQNLANETNPVPSYEWVELPLTNNVVPIIRKIAGLELNEDITASQLNKALSVYPLISTSVEPTKETVGSEGQLYLCTKYDGTKYTHKMYYCSFVNSGTYNWVCFYDSGVSAESGEDGTGGAGGEIDPSTANGLLYDVVETSEIVEDLNGTAVGTTGSPYCYGFLFYGEQYVKCILPKFVDESGTYQYATLELDSLDIFKTTADISSLSEFVELNIGETIDLNRKVSTDGKYTAVLIKSTSQINMCPKETSLLGVIQIRPQDGYCNFMNSAYSLPCEVVTQTWVERYIPKSEAVKINQGIENAGKLLAVDNEGNVRPQAIEIEVETDTTLQVEGKPADAKTVGEMMFVYSENTDNIDTKKYEYVCGNTYFSGFLFPNSEYVVSIKPTFISEIDTYSYKISETDSLVVPTDKILNFTDLTDWVEQSVDEPIVLNRQVSANGKYTVIWLKSTSKIGIGANDNHTNLGFIYSMSNGYTNYIAYNLAPLCTIVSRSKAERYIPREEYEQSNTGWTNRTIGIIGDSFTALGNWSQEMCENLGANRISYAMSAAQFGNQSVSRSAYVQAQMFDTTEKIDAFLIVMGTNDNSREITEITNSKNISDFDLNTYVGGMQACILHLQTNFPNARIFIGWTPANGLRDDSDAHVARMKEVAIWYGIEYLETRSCGFSRHASVFDDCWDESYHPSAKGHRKIAQYMTMLMKSVGGYTDIVTDEAENIEVTE